MDKSLIFLLAIPFFFLLMGIEYLISRIRKKQWYRFADTITNLNIGIGNQAVGLFIKIILLFLYDMVYEQVAFFYLPFSLGSVVFAIILYDFLFYWAHRWSHEWNLFWGAHVVHHSNEDYNLSVALRQPWFHNLVAFFIFLPIPFLGIDTATFAVAAAIQTLYQFWIHTRSIGKLPKPIEYIFNTPSHHRVHHGRNPKYIDKNHAGVLIIWDRIFGTFQVEEEEPTYGITTPLESWNPVWANLHYYADMLGLANKMSRLGDKLKLIFAPPGWKTEELGGYVAPPEVDPAEPYCYHTDAPLQMRSYVGVQLALCILGLMAYMYFFDELSVFYRIFMLGVILLSGMICGAILENKSWGIYAEAARLLIIASGLSIMYYQNYIDWFLVMLVSASAAYVVFTIWLVWTRISMYHSEVRNT